MSEVRPVATIDIPPLRLPPMTQVVALSLTELRSDKAGFDQLAALAQAIGACSFKIIELDFRSCHWFDANMCAPLGVVIAQGVNQFLEFRLVGLSNRVKTILSKNKFLEGFGFAEVEDVYQSTIPYKRFKVSEDRGFAEYLNLNVRGKGLPSMSEVLEMRFKNSILELFVNAAMHSDTQAGIFACGQYFPNKHLLDFCVADAGIGFRKKIFNVLGLKLNSDQAIAWALQEGHTTRQGNVPGGLGLQLIKEFITMNQGRIQIVSDRGYWELGPSGELLSRLSLPFPGTVINIEINTTDKKSYRLASESNNHKV
jgi:hypothetical protein